MVSKCFTWLLRTFDESPYDSLKATYFPIYSNFYTFQTLPDYVRLNEIYSKGSASEPLLGRKMKFIHGIYGNQQQDLLLYKH